MTHKYYAYRRYAIVFVLILIVMIVQQYAQFKAYKPGNTVVTFSNGQTQKTLNVLVQDSHRAKFRGREYGQSFHPFDGMLFLYRRPETLAFRMKNVDFPMDLVFVNKGNRVSKILRNTNPKVQGRYFSRRPIIAVLELPAGMANQLMLERSMLVTWY
ncbi:MAG: DUF192 domain-containing protein [Hyphomicrobiales bacterium]